MVISDVVIGNCFVVAVESMVAVASDDLDDKGRLVVAVEDFHDKKEG